MHLQGHSGQKTSFTGTSINGSSPVARCHAPPREHSAHACAVKQSGHAILTVQPKQGGAEEKYLITLRESPLRIKTCSLSEIHQTDPESAKLRIDGIIWGSPYIELTDSNAIQSSTGYSATIDYKGKGYFSGKPHSFKASVTRGGSSVQTYEGQWTGVSNVGSSKGAVFLDTSSPKEEITVAPVAEQGEWESRKLWQQVASGIRNGNYDAAGKDKSRIEVSSLFSWCMSSRR